MKFTLTLSYIIANLTSQSGCSGNTLNEVYVYAVVHHRQPYKYKSIRLQWEHIPESLSLSYNVEIENSEERNQE